MNRSTRLVVAVLAVGALSWGCNIFDSFAPSESADDYIADGRSALQDGDYATAIEDFQKAVDDDPTDARAHWGLAKAYVRQSGYTSIGIMTELSGFNTQTGENNLLPFMQDPIERVNALYTGLIQANEHLKVIHDGDAWSDELDASAIALDYTGTLAVQGILLFRDTNADNQITSQDFNLAAFFDASGNLTFDPDTWTDVWNPAMGQDPQGMLDAAISVIGESSGVLAGIYADVTGDSLDTGIDTNNLGEVITGLIDGLLNYGATTNP
ncbi:MAG: tetratricopeptide repeat protein [bacterium]